MTRLVHRTMDKQIRTVMLLILAANLANEIDAWSFMNNVVRPAGSNTLELMQQSIVEPVKENIVKPVEDNVVKNKQGNLLASMPRALESLAGGGGETDNEEDYKTMCLMHRDPGFSSEPSFFFFSNKNHNHNTYGCQENIKFTLNITKSIKDDFESVDDLLIDSDSIKRDLIDSGAYNGSLDTYIIVHGFLSSWNSDAWMCKIKDIILNGTEANVFIVDWSGGAKPMLFIDYPSAVANTKYVGKLIGLLVESLIELTGQRDARRFSLMGHSLGAHISGFAGYALNGKLGRIVAFDPAGPCFALGFSKTLDRLREAHATGYLEVNKRRLSTASARLVLALHTDASLFGLDESCAHYDVFVNGGFEQPDCMRFSLKDRFKAILSPPKSMTPQSIMSSLSETMNPTCAHSYSHDFIDTWLYRSKSIAKSSSDDETSNQSVNQCYQMAYECRSWSAFKAGECGFCRDNDAKCVYTGFNLQVSLPHSALVNNETSQEEYDDDQFMLNHSADDDSDYLSFNSEYSSESSFARMKERDLIKWTVKTRHFIRSNSRSPNCLYHYQLVIAVNNTKQTAGSRRFYLQIPLESSSMLTGAHGERIPDRLVMVSHQVSRYNNDKAHARLSNDMKQAALLKHRDNPRQLDYYTALITFKIGSKDQCQDSSVLAPENLNAIDGWYLCRPLVALREARLWAEDKSSFDGFKWVALNFMSGLNERARLTGSSVFERAKVNGKRSRIQSRNELEAESSSNQQQQQQPSLNEISGEKSEGSLLSRLPKSLSCWWKDESDPECAKSEQELQYSMRLRPIKRQRL